MSWAVLAARLGLRRRPDLRLADGSVPPLLWSIGGRPLILLPCGLLEVLDAAGRLVAHELAHFRRRDHWVRWLEAVVLAVYWWHPVAWWARRNVVEIDGHDSSCIRAGRRIAKPCIPTDMKAINCVLEVIPFLAKAGYLLLHGHVGACYGPGGAFSPL